MRIAVVAPSSRFERGGRRAGRRDRRAATIPASSSISIRNASSPTIISPAPTRSAPRRWSRSPTIPASTRSGSRAAATARAGSPSGARRVSGRRRAARPGSAIATPASCSPGSTAPAIANVAHGPMPQRRRCARAARRRWRGRWPGSPARSRDALEPGLEAGRRHAAFNITVLGHAARHAAGARPRRPCADARGGVGAYVRDRPGAVPHHRQPGGPRASPASGSAASATSRPTIPTSARTRRRWSATGASAPASPISAAPTSATTRPTRWCRSAVL